MTEFVKFPSIESFANVWHFMSRKMDPQPIRYAAKIKLHGTNAAIRINADGTIIAQSRTRDLTVQDDNYGFAKWVDRNKAKIAIRPELFKGTDGAADIEHITIFGEWAGNGIQTKDAVTKLDGKFFFVFAVQINDKVITASERIAGLVPDLDHLLVLPEFAVFDDPMDWISTARANAFADKINEWVEQIGECDPFIKEVFEIEGPGEGLVLAPYADGEGMDRDFYSALIFKAKTEAHRVKSSAKAVAPRAEVPAEATEFVTMFVTDARCEQALTEGCGGVADKARTADFLKWIGGDVKKESTLELEQSGLEWKQVAPLVNKAAVRWFMTRCAALPLAA